MIIDRTRYAFRNVSRTFRRQGFVPALKLLGQDAFRFLTQYILNYEHYYLYEHTLEEKDESKFLPKFHNFTFHIISSNERLTCSSSLVKISEIIFMGHERPLMGGQLPSVFLWMENSPHWLGGLDRKSKKYL